MAMTRRTAQLKSNQAADFLRPARPELVEGLRAAPIRLRQAPSARYGELSRIQQPLVVVVMVGIRAGLKVASSYVTLQFEGSGAPSSKNAVCKLSARIGVN